LFIEQSGGGGGGAGEGFDVARNGDARVALIGFPSVGKSTLLGALTETQSEAAAYECKYCINCFRFWSQLRYEFSNFLLFLSQLPLLRVSQEP
jgi:GTPase SAR1 family protein